MIGAAATVLTHLRGGASYVPSVITCEVSYTHVIMTRGRHRVGQKEGVKNV
jgi:hypothetical protein